MKTTERLDKILAHSGFGSRSEIKRLVKERKVTVNGSVALDSGQQVDPSRDELEVDGKQLPYRDFVYIMLNKPKGVVSATEDKRDRTVLDLLGKAYAHMDLFPVGRLDKDTEGLLLLTNDGKLAHNLLSPKKHVEKTYFAEIEGLVNEEDILAFRNGVTLDDGYAALPGHLVILSTANPVNYMISKIELTITEGKFHQVKRMFQAVGKQVVYLKRLSMGPLQLDEYLTPGQYRELLPEELKALLRHQSNTKGNESEI